MRAVRVLAIHNRSPAVVAGGYERILAATLAGLGARGHEHGLLTADDGLPWFGGEARRIGWRERRRVERGARSALRAALRQGRPDVVSLWGLGGLPLALLDELADVPAVGVVGDGWMVYGPRQQPWVRPALDVAHWIFISRYALDRTRAEGHALGEVSIAHPGVDPARFPAAAERPWAGRLAYIGRVAEGKGVQTAVDAAALVDGTELTVDGPLETPLRGVFHHVQTPPDRVHEAYAAADAVLFCVEWPEPWGLVGLEAMAVGRPVIATGTGGSAEYLRDEENCLLVPPGDAAAVAAAVRRLAADGELRARLIAGGRATAARLEQAAFVEAVVTRLEAAATGRAPGAGAR